MLPAIEEVVKWYSLPSVPSALSPRSRAGGACVRCWTFSLNKIYLSSGPELVCLSLH